MDLTTISLWRTRSKTSSSTPMPPRASSPRETILPPRGCSVSPTRRLMAASASSSGSVGGGEGGFLGMVGASFGVPFTPSTWMVGMSS